MGEPQFNDFVRPVTVIGILMALFFGGCHNTPTRPQSVMPCEERIYEIANIPGERALALLSPLDFGTLRLLPGGSGLSVVGSPGQLSRVSTILGLVDQKEEYMVEVLLPASEIRTIPSNAQIAEALGDISIGTFASPPPLDAHARSIIDVYDSDVVVVMPARFRRDLLALGHLGLDAFRRHVTDAASHDEMVLALGGQVPAEPSPPMFDEREEPRSSISTVQAEAISATPRQLQSSTILAQPQIATVSDSDALHPGSSLDPNAPIVDPGLRNSAGMTSQSPTSEEAFVVEASEPLSIPGSSQAKTNIAQEAYGPPPLPNGEDMLEMDLPERIQLIQLLDLVAEYLHLDYVYEPSEVKDEEVTLKLHGKLQGRIQVKDLYPLLESILKFKGLVMTRREGNVVTIVPIRDALEVDPPIVDPNHRAVELGNMVVTRVFQLRYIDASSAANLLENMRLGVATSAISETGTLIITCYAHRMTRIEQLLDVVDRPGKTRRFRFRQLRYTMAGHMIRKVAALAKELQSVPVATISSRSTLAPLPGAPTQPPSLPTQRANQPVDTRTVTPSVYLDADERRNRVLMIGDEEQLAIVEELIVALDVEHLGIRTTRIYGIECVDASDVKTKLDELHFTHGAPSSASIQPSVGPTSQSRNDAARTVSDVLVDEPQIIVLEAANALLICATAEQHAEIAPIIRHIDAVPEDRRTLHLYTIKHVDATEVEGHLLKFEIGGDLASSEKVQQVTSGPVPVASQGNTRRSARFASRQPQVAVVRATNSLLINATDKQHEQIRTVIDYFDVEPTREALPYEVYSLENQDPEQLSEVLSKLIQETILSTEGKIEKTVAKTEDQVTIIPDKNTFSLIVQASRANQDWIASLVEKLDKRSPQVLIDVTLVEITETEAFNYDLNLITSIPDLTHTSGLANTIVPGSTPITSEDILDRLAGSGRSQFADFQSSSGELTAFYGDKHINLLLQAMQSKNYGRVLAKPKILVNDNAPGTIKTADTTYVVKRTSVPVSTGGAGTDATLIETAVDYQSYEAGITLNITPHISQGNLLRMEIELTRSDFRETADTEKPPDTTSSELKTTVFVPDTSTIILGGLLRLNQNKGGTKVPILGDIPLIGGLFRTINNKDSQSKLYIFVKAEIIRPSGLMGQGMDELEAISERDRKAFEEHEEEYQKHRMWPGVESRPTEPPKVLEAR